MEHTEVYEATKARLKAYGVFSDATIETVAAFARKQAAYTSYKRFFKDMGIPKPTLYICKNGNGVPVVDYVPSKKAKGTIVLHLPMANPLDENQLYHVATVIGIHPNYRVIAFGNPSGKPYSFKEQNVSLWQKIAIAFTKNLRPLVAAEIEYLQMNQVAQSHHVGYSYGAHKAMIEAYYLDPNTVQSITLIDPVAHPRGFKQLIHDFRNTFEPMGDYVNRTGIQSYFQAREAAAQTKHHESALRRPMNLAIGVLMRRLDFISMLEKTLLKQASMSVVVAWGSKSELGNDAHMKVSLHRLKYDDKKKITPIQLKNATHAFGNDIHVQAAIIADSLLQ